MEVLAPTQEKSREDELLVIIEDLKAALAQRDETIRCAELKLDVLQQMLFGRRSERLATDDKDLQRRLFNEAESEAPTEGDQPVDDGAQAATTKKKKHPGSGRKRPAGTLERVEIIHDLDPEDSACPWCNSARPKIGEERTEEIEVIPAKVVVKVHVRAKYGPCDCDDFTGHDEKAVITAPARACPDCPRKPFFEQHGGLHHRQQVCRWLAFPSAGIRPWPHGTGHGPGNDGEVGNPG